MVRWWHRGGQGVGADGWARGSSSSDGDETDECESVKFLKCGKRPKMRYFHTVGGTHFRVLGV
jgi:hypothetical protein